MRFDNNFVFVSAGLLASFAGFSSTASAAAISNGNIVVYRVGTAGGTLGSTTTSVFLDEYTPAGTLVQSIAMPTTSSGLTLALTASGSANSEGYPTLSGDGKYIALTGYNIGTGFATPAAAVARTVGVVTIATGSVNTTTGVVTSSANVIRSAYTPDGSTIYATGSSGGFLATTLGTNGTATQLATTPTNNRIIRAFNGQLYGGTGAGTTRIGTIGSGLPTTTGQTFTNLAGVTNTNTVSPYSFYLADLSSSVAGVDTLYIATDGTTSGISKFSLVAGTWVSNGTAGIATDNYRGLDAFLTPSGGVQLYATRNSNEIVRLLDTGGYNSAFTTSTPTSVVLAASGTAFRGLVAIPEPTSLALIGIAGLVALRRRRA